MQVAEEGGGGAEHRDDTPPRFPPRARTSRPSGSVQTDRLMAAVWADNLEADVVSPSCTQDPVAAPIPSRRRASPRSFSDAAGFAASERGSFTRSHLADILEADANDDGDFAGVITGRKLMSTDGFSDASIPMASEKDLNSGSSEVSSPKVKLMCSFEGQILPRPIDGKLRYVGGETRVISVRRSIRIGELLRRLMELYDRAVVLKYQLPEEDLDALVSVSTDEDLENMMEESDKLLSSSVEGGSSLPSKIRVFLFPASGGSDASSMVGIEDRRDSEQRYIDAINEAVDTTSARKQFDASSRGSSQNLAGFEIAEASHSPSSFGFVQASVASWVPIDPVLPPSFNNNNNNNNNSNNNNKRDPGIGKHFGSNMSSSSSSHQFDKRPDTCFTQPSVPPPDSLGVDMPEKQLDSCRQTDFKGHYGNSQTSNLAYPPDSETIPLPPYQKGDVHDLESGFGRGLLSNYNETPQPSKAPILNLPRLLSNYNEIPQPSNESFPGSTRGSFQPISSSSEEPLSNLLPFIDSKDPTFLRSKHNADELEFLSGIWMTTPGPKENQEFTDPQWKTQIETHDKSQSNIFLTPLCDSPMGTTASFSPSQGDRETRNGNSLQQSKEPHPEENLSILSWSIDSGGPSFRCSEHDDVDEAGFLTGAWMAPPLSQKIESKESEGRSTDSNEHSSYDFFGVPPSSSATKQEQTHKSHSEIEAATISSSFEDSQEITPGNSMGQTDERRSEEHSSSLTPLLDGVDPADPSFRRSEHVDVDEAGFLTGGWMMSSLNQKTVSASASSSSSSLEESEGSVDCNEQLYSFLFKDSQLRTQVESINISSSPPAVRETHNSQSESILSHFPSGPISSSSSSSFTSSVVQEDHETRNGNPLQQTQESLSTPLPLSSHNELDVAGESGFSTGTWMTLLSQMVSKQSQVSNDSYEQSYAVLSADYQRRAQLDSKHPLSSSPKNRTDNVELIPSSSPSYVKNSSILNETSKSPPNRGLQDSLSMQTDTREETTPATSLKPSNSVPSSSEGGKLDNMLSVDDLLGLNAKKELNRIDSGTSKSEGDIHPSFKQENSSLVGYSSVDFIFLHHKQTKETPLPITQSDKDSLLPSIIHPLLANTESGATAMPGVEGIEEVIVLESSDSAKPVFSVFESQQEEQKERDRMFDQNWEKVLQQAEAEEQLLIANANEEISKADLELEKEGGNYEESKIEDTNMPRNVAAEAEAEAISRGLQTIRNADLEERRELGSGTFGTVYHGKWRGTDVAIKRIKSSCFMGRPAERESLMADFWREAIILGQLHHPNVVAFYGVVPDGPGGTLATVTEFMVNGSLKHVLQTKDRSIDHRKRLLIAMDAAFGMEYLHGKRIVHFDLKCENLLVNMRDPHRPICKVGDLGLSKVKQQTMVSGGVRGTLPWMAPELLNGSSNLVSERVDVFSFGIAMWEILTGMEPYQDMHYGAIIGGIASNTLRPSIPRSCNPAWRSLMVRCWSADPMERPPFSEIARELRSMAALVQPKAQQAKS